MPPKVPDPQVIAAWARAGLIPYTCLMRPDYRPSAIHRRIARALERIAKGELKRLMIFVPPRHGKSMLVSEHFPAWYLGGYPDRQVIATSYSEDLASGFGRSVRNQLQSDIFRVVFPGCRIAQDAQSSVLLRTQEHGAYVAAGIGGTIVGRGAHLLIIDDPIKSREEADSEVYRRKIKDWYRSVAYTRLMPGGAIVVMHTRWHMDDLAGWLLTEMAHEGWEVLNIPAWDAEEREAAWPEAFPIERLREIRATVGPREWQAQYMGSPTAEGGGEFKRAWFRYYHSTPREIREGMNVFLLVDPANEKRKTPDNDYTSIWVVGANHDQNLYLLDGVRDRLNLTARANMVMRLHRQWKPPTVRYEHYGMQADVAHLQTVMETENYRFHVEEVGGQTPKVDRIRRLIPFYEQGRVYHPEQLTYIDSNGKPVDLVAELERELLSFPAAVHDDMGDALARMVDPAQPIVFPRGPDPHDSKAPQRYGRRRQEVSSWRTA